MITKEQAVNFVNEYRKTKAEQIQKGVDDYLENVISPKIKGVAKDGYTQYSFTVPSNVELELVKKDISKAGFTVSQGIGERHIVITW